MSRSLITPGYQLLNRELHQANKGYGGTGWQWVGPVVKLCERRGITEILDYGCGKGTLGDYMPEGYSVRGFDPAVKRFSARPVSAPLVICTSTMEHIEPEYVDDVLRDIFNLTERVSFFVIDCVPATKELSDGRNAHLTILRPPQWYRKLAAIWPGVKRYSKLGKNRLVAEAWKQGGDDVQSVHGKGADPALRS